MFTALIAALALQADASGAALETHTLTVVVQNVRESVGHVRVDVCTSDEFLGDNCTASGSAPATKGETVVTVPGVGPGVYAVQAFHDRNDNHKVDRGAFGVPTEDVGFSGAPKIGLHGPAFVPASFIHGLAPQAVTVRLKHFF